MSNPSFGDIFLVKFHPSAGNELKRYRPAVIMSNKTNEIDKRFTLIAPLTTKTSKYNPECELHVSENTTGIDKPAILLAWYLRTVDINRLENKLGRLAEQDINKLKEIIANVFEV